MKIRKSVIFITSFTLVLIAVTYLLFFEDSEFNDINGEIILMIGDSAFSTPIIFYNPQEDTLEENRGIYYFPQYNVNNSEHLIAVTDEGSGQSIYEVTSSMYDNTQNNLLYSDDDLSHPKFVPGKNAISYIKNSDELYYYDLGTGSHLLVGFINVFSQYDWLNSSTVLYTDKQNDLNIMAYDIENDEKYIYKENAIDPSLSINKDFLAYKSADERNIVYLENLVTNEVASVNIGERFASSYKPSPDGKYILVVTTKNSESDVVIYNIETGNSRTVIESYFPSVVDWKD